MTQTNVDLPCIDLGVRAHEIGQDPCMVLHGPAEAQGIVHDDDGKDGRYGEEVGVETGPEANRDGE